MDVLYEGFIRLYGSAIRLAALFDDKAKKWVKGRSDFEGDLNKFRAIQGASWIHCASLGEFEQARPIIESIKDRDQEAKIVVSFFSPSGYEIRKNYPLANEVVYLPLDTKSNARKFVQALNPSRAIFVKYEFWPNFLEELGNQSIKTYLVSGIFRKDQVLFKPKGKRIRLALKYFHHFFLQDESSEKLLHSVGMNQTKVCGDTRFDQVIKIASNKRSFESIEEWINGQAVLVAGSTWKEDEELLAMLLSKNQELKLLLAPHEIDDDHLNWIEKRFEEFGCSLLSQGPNTENRVLIVNQIGILSSLYQYGNLAFIGGGFGKGIHNTLEAAVYGIPVLFGPNHSKFKEAIELVQIGGAFSITSATELIEKATSLLSDQENTAGQKAGEYVLKNSGATETIIRNMLG